MWFEYAPLAEDGLILLVAYLTYQIVISIFVLIVKVNIDWCKKTIDVHPWTQTAIRAYILLPAFELYFKDYNVLYSTVC